jgi:hypothetical protein
LRCDVLVAATDGEVDGRSGGVLHDKGNIRNATRHRDEDEKVLAL